MKRLRAIMVVLLSVSLALPAFASVPDTTHCDMMSDASGSMPMQHAEPADNDCCDCSDMASCNVPCLSASAFMTCQTPALSQRHEPKGEFALPLVAITPAPPDKLLRPPISL